MLATLILLSAAFLSTAQQTLPIARLQISSPGQGAFDEFAQEFDGLQDLILSHKIYKTMDKDVYETILAHCPGISSQLRADVSISSELQFETCDSTIVTAIQQQKFIDQLEKVLKVCDKTSYIKLYGSTSGNNTYGGIPIDVTVVLNISELIFKEKKYLILGSTPFPVPTWTNARNFKDEEMDSFNENTNVSFRRYVIIDNTSATPNAGSAKKQSSVDIMMKVLLLFTTSSRLN